MRTSVLYARGVLGIDENDVVFSAAKLFFAYGLGNALTFPLSVGATSILSAERPTPGSIARVMRRHQQIGMLRLIGSLRRCSPIRRAGGRPRPVFSRSRRRSPRHTGETKAGSELISSTVSVRLSCFAFSSNRRTMCGSTTGRPIPRYQLRIVDEEERPVRRGEIGDLLVSGPTSAAYYWNNRERSLSTFHGPWTCTGDRYARDAAGYYTFAGRVDDMLKVGGLWVSPFEVESALSAHDAVLEAAVVGHSDGDGLIKPKAFVVLKDRSHASPALESELKAFVKDRLALYKYPRWIEFIAELPKTPTGTALRLRG
jgi:acyl-coenzyme A synthetase/AMP-(fatty) acid ligase